MLRPTKDFLKSAVIGFAIPAMLLVLSLLILLPTARNQENTAPSLLEGTDLTGTEDPANTPKIQIPVLLDEDVLFMELEEYVAGVVLAEMPASFEMEALKAQAVAARTYALKTCNDGRKHDGAVCTSHLCCQSYMTREDYLQRGWSEKYVLRVLEAVIATAGEVLHYKGELIRSTYFSCSGGSTEDAAEVWGREYPYLQSVKSPGEEETVYYSDTMEFTLEDFQDRLGVSLSGQTQTWFGSIRYTKGGGVDTIEIGGSTYKGTTVRSLLGLRSTMFEIVVSEEKILFVTKGNGHRVGLSQYGADAMALEGADYIQILCHYYVGTVVVRYV